MFQRGVGNPRTICDLGLMIMTHKPTVIFLMETKVLKYKLDCLKVKLGFQNLFFVDGVGLSGGLAMFWRENLSLTIQSFSHRHIIMHG